MRREGHVSRASTLAAVTMAAMLTTSPVRAQDSALVELLVANRHSVWLSGDTLAGDGGRLLLDEAAGARYALLGEEHGIAEIPAFASAWFRGIVPAGYSRLAVEVGPDAGVLLDSLASSGVAALREFQDAHAPGFPFFVLESEAKLLVNARTALPDEPVVIWGIDYDILADRYLFPLLEMAAESDSARAVIRSVQAQADSGIAEAVRTGNPGLIYLFSAPDEPFVRLRRALEPDSGSSAMRVIETMQETAAINRLFMSGENWESNRRRVAWLKRSMSGYLEAGRKAYGEQPKVMVKLGYNHLARGLNDSRQFDVGAMLAQLAEADGERSFHLLVIGGPGARTAAFNPMEMRYVEQPASALGDAAAGAPLAELALENGWTLFDLRPLRPAIHDRRVNASDALVRLAFNFDAVLLISGGTPAQALFDIPAAFR